MAKVYNNTRTQVEGLRIGSSVPLDDRVYFPALADLISVDTDFPEEPFRYYEGMVVYVLSELQSYIWVESGTGILTSGGYTYPIGFISNGVDYSSRTFNFVLFTDVNGSSGGLGANDHLANADLVYDGNHVYTLNPAADSYWEDDVNNRVFSIRTKEIEAHKDLYISESNIGGVLWWGVGNSGQVSIKGPLTSVTSFDMFLPNEAGPDGYRTSVIFDWNTGTLGEGEMKFQPTTNTHQSNFKEITGTTYTLSVAEEYDKQLDLVCNNVGNLIITIPPNSTEPFPIGFKMEVHRIGTGQAKMAAGAGVTIRTGSNAGKIGLKVIGDRGILHKIDTNIWHLHEFTTT